MSIDFKNKIAELISGELKIDRKEIYDLIEIPPNPSMGDYAFPCFSLAKELKKSPAEISKELAPNLISDFIERSEWQGPYVNFFIKPDKLAENILPGIRENMAITEEKSETVCIESPSPNANKPLHLGHVRNMLLGTSLKKIFDRLGNKVVMVEVVNDRGVHICKSMLAYQKEGADKTPISESKKPDHFVGDYYVKFQEMLKDDPELDKEAQAMLVKWENNDPETRKTWEMMRKWCLDGFARTYSDYGMDIDKAYYESDLYLHGKKIVEEGLKTGIFQKDESGAVFVDLAEKKLDKKYLQRSDGTSIYITQDLFLAKKRFDDYKMDRMIYVVGNEQIYHFKVLFEIFKLLNYSFADRCYHLAYGMIELPEGKMKSREGTVVDADDLRNQMISLARDEVEKRYPNIPEDQKEKRSRMIAMGALKFFILKFDAMKNFVYNPKESISFQGETGPYVQYVHARICSIFRKSRKTVNEEADLTLLKDQLEKELIQKLGRYSGTVKDAARQYKPSSIAQYLIELAQMFNAYYHTVTVLVEDENLTDARLMLLDKIRIILKDGLSLLGIESPERM